MEKIKISEEIVRDFIDAIQDESRIDTEKAAMNVLEKMNKKGYEIEHKISSLEKMYRLFYDLLSDMKQRRIMNVMPDRIEELQKAADKAIKEEKENVYNKIMTLKTIGKEGVILNLDVFNELVLFLEDRSAAFDKADELLKAIGKR
jgi:hypothetical protein